MAIKDSIWKHLPLKNITINDNFWKKRIEVNSKVTLLHQYHQFVKTGTLKNFKHAGDKKKTKYNGLFFSDASLYKWIEAACYNLMIYPDTNLGEKVEEAVRLIASAQEPEGYLNTYYQVVEPSKKFTNFGIGHELYCAGHLIEAAVAHFIIFFLAKTGISLYTHINCKKYKGEVMDREFVVNTKEQCTTINYFDQGKRYYFFIKNRSLFYQREGSPVRPVPNPYMNCSIERIAADNNRILVLTSHTDTGEKKLYWACIKKDIAAWVEYIFSVADILTSPDESINEPDIESEDIDALITFILDHFSVIKLLLLNELSLILNFMEMQVDEDKIEKTMQDKCAAVEKGTVQEKKHALKDLLNYLFTFLLKNSSGGELHFQKKTFDSFDHWVTEYRKWVAAVHEPFVWNEIQRVSAKVQNVGIFRTKPNSQPEGFTFNVDCSDIAEIGIGNWHQTVTTFYILLQVDPGIFNHIFNGELNETDKPLLLLYLDEEPIMHFWKVVPGKINQPYPFFPGSVLNASHSVISVTKKNKDQNKLYWIRHDYHNFEDFAWFPLNWTEYFYNNAFDVDTFRLYIAHMDPDQNKRFMTGMFLPKILEYLFGDKKGKKKELPTELAEIFKETGRHHPGWHYTGYPEGNAGEYHIKVCMDNPWPVPDINVTMSLILNMSGLYETLPVGKEKIQEYSKITDTALELLKRLHSQAKIKTKEANLVNEIPQHLGFLGENPLIPSYNYPVRFIIKQHPHTYKICSLPTAEDIAIIQWEDMAQQKKYTLKASNNNFVCVRRDREYRLYAQKREPDSSAGFIVYRLNYDTVAIGTEDGRFIGIDDSKPMRVIAEQRAAGTWQTFTIIPVEIAIRAANGKYVYVDPVQQKVIRVAAAKDSINNQSTFILRKTGDNTYRIINKHTNLYLVSPHREGERLGAEVHTSAKETDFIFKRAGMDRWCIRTAKGFYLGLEGDPAHSIVTGSKKISDRELFTIVFLKIALKINKDKYLCKTWAMSDIKADEFNRKRSLFELKTPENEYFS